VTAKGKKTFLAKFLSLFQNWVRRTLCFCS